MNPSPWLNISQTCYRIASRVSLKISNQLMIFLEPSNIALAIGLLSFVLINFSSTFIFKFCFYSITSFLEILFYISASSFLLPCILLHSISSSLQLACSHTLSSINQTFQQHQSHSSICFTLHILAVSILWPLLIVLSVSTILLSLFIHLASWLQAYTLPDPWVPPT